MNLLFLLILPLFTVSGNTNTNTIDYTPQYNLQIGDEAKYKFTQIFFSSPETEKGYYDAVSIFPKILKNGSKIDLKFNLEDEITIRVENITINELYNKTGNEIYNYKTYNLSYFYGDIQLKDIEFRGKSPFFWRSFFYQYTIPAFDNASIVDEYISNQTYGFAFIRDNDLLILNDTLLTFSEILTFNWKTGWLQTYEFKLKSEGSILANIRLENISTKKVETIGISLPIAIIIVTSALIIFRIKRKIS